MPEAVIERFTRGLEMTCVEALQDVPGASSSTVTNNRFNIAPQNYRPSTGASRAAHIDETILPMTGSAVTIDLTNCPGGLQDDIDATGKQVKYFYLKNEGNAAMTIEPGSSNGYELFGSGPFELAPGGVAILDLLEAPTGLADVAAGSKNIDITGGSGQTYQLAFVFG